MNEGGLGPVDFGHEGRPGLWGGSGFGGAHVTRVGVLNLATCANAEALAERFPMLGKVWRKAKPGEAKEKADHDLRMAEANRMPHGLPASRRSVHDE